VLNVLLFAIDLIERHAIWLYLACLFMVLYNLRGYHLAHRDRVNTIFPVEREVAAHKEGRHLSNIGLILAIAAIVTGLKYYIVPTVDVSHLAEPTPTVPLLIATPSPTATESPAQVTPSVTPRPLPTRAPTAASTPTPSAVVATSLPPAPACPDANICISTPRSGATVAGVISIQGAANHARFQFFKVEYGAGEAPASWHSIGDVVHTPVTAGALMSFNTASLPNGVYWLRLTVVDATGNFPPPFTVRVVIQN
jgi:hypothetical protein